MVYGRQNLQVAFPFIGLLVVFTATLLSPSVGLPAPVKSVRRVLIFYELGLSSPAVSVLDREILGALEKSPFQIELYREYLETTLFSDQIEQQNIRDSYLQKYRNRKPDLIIALGPSPLRFIVDVHERAFKDVPVVFGLTTPELADYPKLDPQFTGVWESIEPEKTLEIALRLQRGIRHVVVVGGTSSYDRHVEALFRDRLRDREKSLDIEYLTDLDMPSLLDRLAHLPQHTIILYANFEQDAAGTPFIAASQADPMIAAAANAPIFTPSDVDWGHGEVGGYVQSFSEEGKVIGKMTQAILGGRRPSDVPIAHGANVYMFDWRALRRWGLKESNLPPGSIVLNRQPTVWEAYKWYIVGGICLVLAQTSLIAGLLWQRWTRRKAEAELALTYDRLRLSVETGKAVGWDLDVKSRCVRWFGDLRTMFAMPSDTFNGRVEDFYRHVYPEDREAVRNAVADARRSHMPYAGEFRVVRDDQTVRWITARGKFYYTNNGEAERMMGMALDITDRKLAEQQVRESEERFRLVANTAPVMIWMSGTDKLCNYFNKPWLDFTGRTLEQELGHGWSNGVHCEDYALCLKTYADAFDKREKFEMQYRLRHHDGGYRWVYDVGVPRFKEHGEFAGYIGSCTDVTERKHAEEALSTIGRRLIEAHEEERTWIGRELHDDVNQRLALLAVELDQWDQNEPDGHPSERLSHAKKRIIEISQDVQALSHRLHSSKLEYLGLTAASRSFCKELSEKTKVEVRFDHSEVPPNMPKDVALCLFRVLQEALQNAIKYSGVRLFHVTLCGSAHGLELIVSDDGKGFCEHEGLSRQGIGLISMRERLQMVNGVLGIKTQPGAGTTISARVPLQMAEQFKAG